MTFALVIDCVGIPPDARVDQRIPKRLLVEQGAPTPADKRYIQDGIEEIFWVAALKPTNIGIPIFRDDVREYLEIAVVTVQFRLATKASRLIELIHRAIPYPIVLIAAHGDAVSVSLAHKRWSKGEVGRVVLEELRQIQINPNAPLPEEASFLSSLSLSRLRAPNLFALYQKWLDQMAALEAARITGVFTATESIDHARFLRDCLDQRAQLQRDMVLLRAQAEKEKRLKRRVELNLEIKQLQAKLVSAEQIFKSGTVE